MAKLDGTNGLIQQYDYQVLTTAFSYTFAAGTQTLIINPAGTLATGTVTMPAAPANGMVITVESTQIITALTLSGNTGQSIVGVPATLFPNQPLSYVYRLSNTTWYPFSVARSAVLQVVPANLTATQISTTNTSFVTTNFSASITPSSATSKVYVVFMGENLNSNSAYYGMQTLYRNSTNLGGSDGMVQNNNTSAWLPFTISYTDSPATTSSTTYAIYQRTANAANTVYVGWGVNAIHTFVLMEIAA